MPDPVVVDGPFEVDDDVAAEADRVMSLSELDAQHEVIVMKNLRKVYVD